MPSASFFYKSDKNNAIEQTIRTIEELKKLVPVLLERAGDSHIFTLTGDLGSGKTTLVKAIGAHLGVTTEVKSPTYSLINEYAYQDRENQPEVFYHMDLYRLKSAEEALDIGLEDYLYSGKMCFIEWPEVAENILPEERVKISLEIIEDSIRKIVIL